MQLFSYYRSTAAYRVRIALQYKKIPCEIIPIDLLQKKHREKEYLEKNPQARVPLLVDGDFKVGQSMAILEYLEERYPDPALLPTPIEARAWIRNFSQIIACDMHPLNNVGSLNYLRENFSANEEQVQAWYHHWLRQGFTALEILLAKNLNRGKFCWGDLPTFADVCLVPQVYNAYRFKFDMKDYPLIQKINNYCLEQSYFKNAAPECQPDYRA